MIIVRIWEGLGNQMFQYAFAKSYQRKTGRKVLLDCKDSYRDSLPKARISKIKRAYGLDAFRITLRQVDMEKQKKWAFMKQDTLIKRIVFFLSSRGLYPYRFIQEEDGRLFQRKYYALNSAYFMGWFQNEKYFRDIRKELLTEFRPRKKIKISRELEELLYSDELELVSVHVRRGDYKMLGCNLDLSYYDKAMKYMNTHVEHPVYLVFSDDAEWVKEHLQSEKEIYYIADMGKYQDYEELILMSKCRHNIIANSTFSWWGAWLNQNKNKIIIAPNRWMGDQTAVEKLIPNTWIRITC